MVCSSMDLVLMYLPPAVLLCLPPLPTPSPEGPQPHVP
jgi:hypothetical protein